VRQVGYLLELSGLFNILHLLLMIEGYPPSHLSGSYGDLFTGVLGLNSI
jgi:hypothetical protein